MRPPTLLPYATGLQNMGANYKKQTHPPKPQHVRNKKLGLKVLGGAGRISTLDIVNKLCG